MRRGLVLLNIAIMFGLVTFMFGGLAGAAVKYCVGDNVVPGGVNNSAEVASAYNYPRVSHVYRYFGITQQGINGLDSQSVNGTVTKTGRVIVDGRVVATDAISAGCGFMPGSTKVDDGYMTFYTRPTSVSFAQSSLPAMVVMNNDRFAYAILTSCGNPIKATPVKPKKTAPVKPPTSAPTQTQSQTQTQTVVVNSPPQVEAAETAAPAAPTKSLPNTGPGNVLGFSGLATVIGSAGHYLYRRRRY